MSTVHVRDEVMAARMAGARTNSVGSVTVAVTVCLPGERFSVRRSISSGLAGQRRAVHLPRGGQGWLLGCSGSTQSTRSAPTGDLAGGCPGRLSLAEIRWVIISRLTWS